MDYHYVLPKLFFKEPYESPATFFRDELSIKLWKL
jgi:hypothetical protein